MVPIPILLPEIVTRVVSVVWKNIEPEPLELMLKFWLSEVLISLRDGVESYEDPISIPPILVLKAPLPSLKKYRLFIPPPYIDCTLMFPFTSNDWDGVLVLIPTRPLPDTNNILEEAGDSIRNKAADDAPEIWTLAVGVVV